MSTFSITTIFSLFVMTKTSNVSDDFTTTEAYVPPRFRRRIGCPLSKDCLIDCAPTDGVNPCVHAWIFGINAKSLTVICNHSSSVCDSTFVNCPMHSGAPCNIICGNRNEESVSNGAKAGECENMHIEGTITTGPLQLECKGTHACKGMNVFCPSYGKNNCHIQCKSHEDEHGEGYGACSQMMIHAEHNHSLYTDYLELQCDKDQCNELQFHCWDQETVENNSTIQSNLTYNEDQSQYECQGDQCCPLSLPRSVSLRGYVDQNASGTDIVMIMVVVLIAVSVFLVGVFSAYCAFKARKMKTEDVYYLSP